jgi:chromosome segregation ATPase
MQQAKFLNIRLVMLLIAFACSATIVSAEPKPAGDGTAIKKAQGMIRQLSQEKTALEAEKTAWLNEKTQLEAKLKTLEENVKKLQPLQVEVERYKSTLETTKTSLDNQLDTERQQKQVLLQKHNDVVVKANAINADNQLLVQAVKEREQWIEQCAANNKALRNVNLDMLKKYQDKGIFQQLGELDAITGIGQIDSETAVEEYRYKLQQLKITPFQSKDDREPPPAAVENPAPAESGQ